MRFVRLSFTAAVVFLFASIATPSAAQVCVGDCNGDGTVTINELITGVNIALGSAPVLVIAVLAVVGFLALSRSWALALFTLAASLGGLGVSSALKYLMDRPRPELVPREAMTFTSSFPSGHSMMSAVVYLTLAALVARLMERRRLKGYALAVALGLTVLVGLSRVYLGVHWPSDVLAGWSAGAAWALACWLAARALKIGAEAER